MIKDNLRCIRNFTISLFAINVCQVFIIFRFFFFFTKKSFYRKKTMIFLLTCNKHLSLIKEYILSILFLGTCKSESLLIELKRFESRIFFILIVQNEVQFNRRHLIVLKKYGKFKFCVKQLKVDINGSN